MPGRRYVVVSGPPASGKSTLAVELADRLGLPLVAKDTIEDALIATLPAERLEQSRQLGRASSAVMFAVAGVSPIGAVLESVFARSLAVEELGELPGPIVEVFCRCDRETARDRYRACARSRPGHFDAERSDEDIWNDENSQPIAGGWAVIELRTDRQTLDLERLVRAIWSLFGDPGPYPD